MTRSEDTLLHEPSDTPYWNESGCFLYHVPERQLMGMAYFWHRPNMNLSGSRVMLWDASGCQPADALFYEYSPYNALPAGAQMFDFKLDSGLSCSMQEPLKSYRVGYQSSGCELDITFDAVTPPYATLDESVLAGQGQASPEMQFLTGNKESANTGHYQQGGRVRGRVKLEDEVFDVDCFGWHDHSWGPRKPFANFRRIGYGHCFTETTSWDVLCVGEHAEDDDPFIGTTERAIMGMYSKNDLMGRIVSGHHRVLEFTEDGRALRVVMEATDEHGRELQVEGRCENWFKWDMFTTLVDVISLTRWEFDGQVAYGEHEDVRSLRQNRRLQRLLSDQSHLPVL